MRNYSLNKVEGFNPYDHVEVAKDRRGEDIVKSDGTPLKYLSTAAKTLWFRKVYPHGLLKTEFVETPRIEYGEVIRYRASVQVKDCVLAEIEHQEIVWDIAEMDTTVSKVQTIAIGKALSKAGFGCEIELELGIRSEGETETSETTEGQSEPPKKKRGRPKKEETVEDKEENLEAEVENLMSEIEKSVTDETKKSEETPDNDTDVSGKIDEFLKMELVTTEKAPINIKKMEGLTLGEILADHKDFGSLVKTRPNIKNALSEECAEALIYIEDNK